MSLNGLEDVKVKEAHEAAIAEPGGWFLLQYASRDEIEILASGTAGPIEIRNVISKQEEPSPLYGFLRYRRKNVLIKYLPEDSSRLVQARAAVHFNAICDFFAHSTVFEISKAKDLKDSKLAAACSLHATSGSSSSSNSSLRRRRLNEIAEEEEEEEREKKRQSIVKEETRPTSSIYSETPGSPKQEAVLDRDQITNPQEAAFASTKNVPDFTGVNIPVSPTKSDFNRRLSTQSERPRISSSSSSLYGRPKVKLGPRPSMDVNKRPATASNFRPVAALPAGFKFFKGSKKGKPHERDAEGRTSHDQQRMPPALTIPEGTQESLPPRPATSSGASVKSVAPSMTPSVATTREGKIPAEKARLMKAMKLREKKLQSAKTQAAASSTTTEKSPATEIPQSAQPQATNETSPPPISNTESTAELQSPVTIKTEDTASDSHPSSPVASSIGVGESTKASSLSESTDETVQPSKDQDQDIPDEVQGTTQETPEPEEKMHEETSATESRDGSPKEPSHTSEIGSKVNDVSGATDKTMTEESSSIPTNEPLASQTMTNPEANELAVPEKEEGAIASKSESAPPEAKARDVRHATITQTISQDDIKPNAQVTLTEEPEATTANLESKFVDNKSVAPEEAKAQANIQVSEVPLITKRKPGVKPIRTDLIVKPATESEYLDPLDDDALMDELQTATVQEAKPILVSKSPITPVFPNSRSPPRSDAQASRSVSNPMRPALLSPGDVSQSTARSVSAAGAAYLHNITRQNSGASLQKKNNVGSSISQRIKALEALSGNAGEEGRPRPTTPSATFFTVRKPSTREPSKSPSVAERANSMTRQSPTPERSRQGTPDASSKNRERSESVVSRLNMFEGSGAPRGRPESVQVTARILRDSSSPFSKTADTFNNPSDPSTAEFRQSTLLVDVHRAQAALKQPVNDSPAAADNAKTTSEVDEKENKRRPSLGLVRDFIKEHATISNKSNESLVANSSGAASLKSPTRPPPAARHNSNSMVRRMSTSSRRSSIDRERDNASGSGRTNDGGSGDESKSLSDKKSNNRTSRFIRRLSSSFGSNRKNVNASISPTVAEEDADQLEKASAMAAQVSSPTIVAFMGDVNVQFPDNLLWKRRSICLDASGYLFLSTVQGAARTGKEKAGTKRYHLSRFRKPYIPDVEIQELPNSVVLDFVDGSSLQIACEDRAGQQNVLQTLQEAHRGHAALKAHQSHTTLRQ